MSKTSLIVPIMRTIIDGCIPDELMLGRNGKPMFVNNIEGLAIYRFSDVYIVYTPELDKYVSHDIEFDYPEVTFHFCAMEMTSSEPETIVNVIQTFNISGAIFIKDSDHFFCYDDSIDENGIVVYSLENMVDAIIPKKYSYVNLDDNMQVTNIIEKRIISDMFNCGGYIFEDADTFVDAYNEIHNSNFNTSRIYISHIIYYMMINNNITFKGFKAILYKE